jgi:hypothetical protein
MVDVNSYSFPRQYLVSLLRELKDTRAPEHLKVRTGSTKSIPEEHTTVHLKVVMSLSLSVEEKEYKQRLSTFRAPTNLTSLTKRT